MIYDNQIINIENAQYIDGYKIRLEFNDKKVQVINFSSFILSSHNPNISKYKDLTLFKAFSITEGDLEWNDYDLCFSIADLYENTNIEVSSSDINQVA